MQVDVPRHLKDLIQPRLRAMTANLSKLKAAPASSSNPSTNCHDGNGSRNKTVYSLQETETPDSATADDEDPDARYETGIMHSIGLVEPSIPGTDDDYDPLDTAFWRSLRYCPLLQK